LPAPPARFVGPGVIGDAVPIIPVKTPQRDRRTDDICGQVARQTLIPCGDLTLLDVRHKPRTITRITRRHQPPHLRRLDRLASHRQQRPRPLLAQHGIWSIVAMHPLPGLRLPSATGGDDVQMGVVLAMAAMRLDHHDVATLERGATDPTADIV
jgi:hypothetical protein